MILNLRGLPIDHNEGMITKEVPEELSSLEAHPKAEALGEIPPTDLPRKEVVPTNSI